MPIFRVSQSESWYRIYTIEADTLEAAKEKYALYVASNFTEDEGISESNPEYIDDIKDDVVWFDANGFIEGHVYLENKKV